MYLGGATDGMADSVPAAINGNQPAALSDGEFVVNAKAVRGIGRLKGAGKTKAEQRQEGARMMYALQRAGEKAMGKA